MNVKIIRLIYTLSANGEECILNGYNCSISLGVVKKEKPITDDSICFSFGIVSDGCIEKATALGNVRLAKFVEMVDT